MTHKEAQRMLAEEMVEMLKSDNGGPLKWNETKLHLMEVVRYVFVSEMLKDGKFGDAVGPQGLSNFFNVVIPNDLVEVDELVSGFLAGSVSPE